jgi:seryl-tRNA synthetase
LICWRLTVVFLSSVAKLMTEIKTLKHNLAAKERQLKKQQEKFTQTIAKLEKKLRLSGGAKDELERLRKSLVENEHKRRELEKQLEVLKTTSPPSSPTSTITTPTTTNTNIIITTTTTTTNNNNIGSTFNTSPNPSIDFSYELFSWMTLALKLNASAIGAIVDIDKPALFQHLMDRHVEYSHWPIIIMNALQGKPV